MYTVKAKHNGKWIFGYVQFRKKTNDAVMWVENEEGLFTWLHIDKETVCRPTGISDKSKIKIFEGDKFDYNNEIRFVEYLDDLCRFVLTNGKGYDSRNCIDLDCDVIYELDIIGNIHD